MFSFLLCSGSSCASLTASGTRSGFRIPELDGLEILAEPMSLTWGGEISLPSGKSICNSLLTAAFCGFESSWWNLPPSGEPFPAFRYLTRRLILLYQTQAGAALNRARPVSLASVQTRPSTKQKYLKPQELENGGVAPSTQTHCQLAANRKLFSGSPHCVNTESQNYRCPSIKSFASEAWIFLSQDGINKCRGELFFS